MRKILLTLTIFALAMPLSARPSWCRYAKTNVEKRICNSRSLGDLDYELTRVYRELSSIYRNEDYSLYRWLVRSEKRWIRSRDRVCYSRSNRCIRRKYRERIEYLYDLLDEVRE